LFALFISAYSMRMSMVDWRALPVPRLLWFNTGVLVLSSVALQRHTWPRAGTTWTASSSVCAQGEHPPSHSWSGSCWRGNS
jgi:cytochrome c oxidase subunit III